MSEIYEVLAGDSFGRFNKKLARIAGLSTACYWSCLSNITTKVVKKKKFDEQGFFKIDRKYITNETSLTEEEQLVCDSSLKNLGVLDSDPEDINKIRVRSDKMLNLLIETDVNEIKKISKVAKVSKADKSASKKEGIIHRLQSRVNEKNEEVYKLYCDLIDVCYSHGMNTNAQIDLFQETLNNFTTDDEVKKEILRIAIAGGWKVADWSIDQYNKSHKVGTRIGVAQKKATGLSDIEL